MEQQKQPSRKRRTIKFPLEAEKIAERPDLDATTKCKEIAAVSGNDIKACWRFLKHFNVERPPELKRQQYPFPEEAKKIARSQDSVLSKCEQLKRVTGYPERVCRAFLKRNGVEPPRARRRNVFSEAAFERLFDCVQNHGPKEAATRFKVDCKTIYNELYRRGLTGRWRGDDYTLADLQMLLRVRQSTILHWVELGLLKAKLTQRSHGKPIHRFGGPEVLRFCRENMSILLPRRWPLKRLEFIELLLLNGVKHADQLSTREAKKEQGEYEKQMGKEAVAKLGVASTRNEGHNQNSALPLHDCA